MKKVSKSGDRLSSSMNARFDLIAPKREFENSEKQINKIKKESQKNYEWEMKQLSRKLGGVPGGRSPPGGMLGMPSQGGLDSSRKPSDQRFFDSASRKTSQDVCSSRLDIGQPSTRIRASSIGTSPFYSKDGLFSADPSITNMFGQVGVMDKQGEALRQLKFLYETAVALVADAEATGAAAKAKTSVPGPSGKPEDQQSPGAEEAESAVEETLAPVQQHETTTPKRDGPKGARNFAALKASMDSAPDSHPHQPPPPPPPPPVPAEASALSSRRTSKIGRPVGLSCPTVEYQGVPSQAVQMMSMIRALTMGTQLSAKQVKGLTAVIEESRTAVKAVKSSQDPERAQEKLNKRLTELLDLVKPSGTDITLSAEQLLNCSYLRLTKDNVRRLEDVLRDQGFEPGIHSHTDVTKVPLFERASASTSGLNHLKPLPSASQDQNKLIQPMSIYQTKAGSPMSKKRTAKPDSVVGQTEEEENLARLKKYRVN